MTLSYPASGALPPKGPKFAKRTEGCANPKRSAAKE